MDRSGMTGREFIVGIAIVLVFGSILGAILFPPNYFGHRESVRKSARRVSCAGNLKQFGLLFSMYSNESLGGQFPRNGFYYDQKVDCDAPGYPAVGEKVGVLTGSVNARDVFPEYMSDPTPFVCPSAPDDVEIFYNSDSGDLEITELCIQDGRGVDALDSSYTYLGYYFFDKVDKESPAGALRELGFTKGTCADIDLDRHVPIQLALYVQVLNGLKESDPERLLEMLNTELDLTAASGWKNVVDLLGDKTVGNSTATSVARETNMLRRSRADIHRIFTTDPNHPEQSYSSTSKWPIMFDNVGLRGQGMKHLPGGSNVLFMDGHVEYIRYLDDGPFPINGDVAALFAGCFAD